MLLVEGLTKHYDTVTALDDVHFSVERGQIVGFLGPNGAGKTTAMRAIMGLIALDAGRIRWDGGPLDRTTRQRFGYMPADRGLYPRMRVREHLSYYARLSGHGTTEARRSADEWLERLDLADRGDDTVQSLSSGNQQRVQLALALLNEPELLVLDEPFAGLDPLAVQTLSDLLRDEVAKGTALLLSSHQLDLVADVCSAVVIVDRGHVVLRGDVAELRSSTEARHLDVEFARETTWQPPTVTAVSSDGRRYRAVLEAGADSSNLIAHARATGEVIAFAFAPPDLSEVFMGAVGRNTVDDPDHGADGHLEPDADSADVLA